MSKINTVVSSEEAIRNILSFVEDDDDDFDDDETDLVVLHGDVEDFTNDEENEEQNNGENDDVAEAPVIPTYRKQLTAYHLVNSIDAAQDQHKFRSRWQRKRVVVLV